MTISKIHNLKYAFGLSNIKISKKFNPSQKKQIEKLLPDLEKCSQNNNVNIKLYPDLNQNVRLQNPSKISMDVIKTKFFPSPSLYYGNNLNPGSEISWLPIEYKQKNIINIFKPQEIFKSIADTAKSLEKYIKDNNWLLP